MQIARSQRKEIDALRDTLLSIEGVAGRPARDTFAQLRVRLDNWAARVAVIGQVKAGKSSFLNAFLGQQDFLPSDVNPWTSVVTNLRINLAGDPETGARFEFFDETAWDEIVNGGSEVRRLTEQLLPGFDADLLRAQTEAMKTRAQERLGAYYQTLLGTHHDYDVLTPELLQRYVCAGHGDEGTGGRSEPGRYAAITRVANLYFRRPEFAVPTVLTDTPGVNDPFLVRDEFTCRSLDKSDVFIVVLSAHQALTEVDVALMRILAQQDDKDVIVFINRIDELDDFDTDVQRVVGDVSRRLQAAIPDVEFTIHAGSAWFADLALRGDDEAALMREALDDEHLHSYLHSAYGFVPATERERFLLASGLEDVKRTLSMVIDHGIGSQQIAQLVEDARAEIAALQTATRRERDSIQMQVERMSANNAQAAFKALERELEQLEGIATKVEAACATAVKEIDGIMSRSTTALTSALDKAIADFIGEQQEHIATRLSESATAGAPPTRMEIDLLPLRAHLEGAITARYAAARAEIDKVLDNGLAGTKAAAEGAFDSETDGITMEGLPGDDFASTLTLARKRIDLGLITARTWAFWRRREIDLAKTMDALRQITAADLRPAIQTIVTAFSEALAARAVAGQNRMQVIRRMIEGATEERSRRLRSDKARMEQIARDPEELRRMVHRLHGQLEVLERRIQYLAVNDSTLGRTTLSRAA